MSYQEKIKAHLSEYKRNTFPNYDNGIWSKNGKEYPHILSIDEKFNNLLEPYKNELANYISVNGINLHSDFHHLNSSQALCFNLFYPLFHKNKKILTTVIHRILEIPPVIKTPKEDLDNLFNTKNEVKANLIANQLENQFITDNAFVECEFEKVLDKLEYTNFDFFVLLKENKRVLFEIKYTESKFGSAKKDASHLHKYETIYQHKLKNIIKPQYHNIDFVLENYQIFRNLCYIDNDTTIVFLYPQANEKLKYANQLINEVINPDKMEQVRIVFLEDLVEKILSRNEFRELRIYYNAFQLKYLI